jgi:hypothetical protein
MYYLLLLKCGSGVLNPTSGMKICLVLFCVGGGLVMMGPSHIQGFVSDIDREAAEIQKIGSPLLNQLVVPYTVSGYGTM